MQNKLLLYLWVITLYLLLSGDYLSGMFEVADFTSLFAFNRLSSSPLYDGKWRTANSLKINVDVEGSCRPLLYYCKLFIYICTHCYSFLCFAGICDHAHFLEHKREKTRLNDWRNLRMIWEKKKQKNILCLNVHMDFYWFLFNWNCQKILFNRFVSLKSLLELQYVGVSIQTRTWSPYMNYDGNHTLHQNI